MKDTLLKKILVLILLTVILSAALTALIFNYTGASVFSNIKTRELEPRAKYVADLTADYIQGNITQHSYARTVGSEYRIWDASLYVYNVEGQLFVYPRYSSATETDPNIVTTKTLLSSVLEGKSLSMPGTVSRTSAIVGEPVFAADGAVIGAVFMVKPIKEVVAALHSLNYALVISMMAVTVIMILPAYIGSRGITKPIRQMIQVADAMACGDFSARAFDEGKDEIAQLGKALNYLSSTLSGTINDLTFERNRLRAVLFGLGEGIIGVNAQGELTQFNPSAVRLMGGGPEDDLTALPAYADMALRMRQALQEGRSESWENTCGEALLRFTMTPLTSEEGENEGAVTLVQDITESERLEQTRRDYVANVSHELRTPIASIRSLADALHDDMVKTEADKARYYGYILKESMRLSRLIDDLLELSRLQSGTIALTKQRMRVDEMLYDVADRYLTSAAERGQTVHVELPENCPYAYSNPDRAEQVLIALLDNAIKHTQEGEDIHMRVTEKEDKLCISVTNPGQIAPEDIGHVFERFYKVDKSHSGGGTGLGLAIAAEIMQLLNEDITAKCSDGQVIFSFTLQKYEKADG